jgi:WD40 repeat protein
MRSAAISPLTPRRPLRTFGGHPLRTDGDLLALAFTAEGLLCSIEEPGILRRWDVGARLQQSWVALDELATFWTFHPNGRLLAACSDEVGIWEAASGEQLIGWSLPSWCTAVAFQPTGPLVATGHDDGSLFLWDRTTGRQKARLEGHSRPISTLTFSADGTRLASAGEERDIHLWNVGDGKKIGSLIGHTDRIPALVWHPDGQRLYSAGWDTTARVWDVRTCEPIILLNSHASQVHTLALSADGRLLACADSANAIHLWDTATNRTRTVLRDNPGETRCLAVSADGGQLAWGGSDRIVHLWDAREGVVSERASDPVQARTSLAISPDGSRLYSLGAGTDLRIWQIDSGQRTVFLEGAPTLHAFAVSPDGRWIAASRAEGAPSLATLGLYSAADGKRQAILEGQAAPITALAFPPESNLLAAGGTQSGDVWLWRIHAGGGEPLVILPDAAGGKVVETLAFHSAGRWLAVGGIDWLASGGVDGWVGIWDVVERKQTRAFPGGARAVAFQPGGRLLAVASLNRTVRLFDAEAGNLVQELVGHLDAVSCVAFSPDGRWLASGGDDRTVRLWDAASGEPIGAVELDTQLKALVFSPDGQTLFTGNGNTSCYQFAVDSLLTMEP